MLADAGELLDGLGVKVAEAEVTRLIGLDGADAFDCGEVGGVGAQDSFRGAQDAEKAFDEDWADAFEEGEAQPGDEALVLLLGVHEGDNKGESSKGLPPPHPRTGPTRHRHHLRQDSTRAMLSSSSSTWALVSEGKL